MIYGIAHTALYTDKFNETIQFYISAFEAKELGYFETDKRGCWLKIGNSVLEIFESGKLPDTGCFKHIAIQCDDTDKYYHRALAYGASEYVKPNDICLELYEPRKLKIAFVKEINGEQIELCENK